MATCCAAMVTWKQKVVPLAPDQQVARRRLWWSACRRWRAWRRGRSCTRRRRARASPPASLPRMRSAWLPTARSCSRASTRRARPSLSPPCSCWPRGGREASAWGAQGQLQALSAPRWCFLLVCTRGAWASQCTRAGAPPAPCAGSVAARRAQAQLLEEHELAERDSRFLAVDGLRVHYKAAHAPPAKPGTGALPHRVAVLHGQHRRGCAAAQQCRRQEARPGGASRCGLLRAVLSADAVRHAIVCCASPRVGTIWQSRGVARAGLTAGAADCMGARAQVQRRRASRWACCTALAPTRSAGRSWTGASRRAFTRWSPRTTCRALGSRSGAPPAPQPRRLQLEQRQDQACAGPACTHRHGASPRRHADLDKYSLRFNGHIARRIMDHELARDAPAAGAPPCACCACCERRRSRSDLCGPCSDSFQGGP